MNRAVGARHTEACPSGKVTRGRAETLRRRVGRWTFPHPMIQHDKLFIPGPVEVSPKTMAAFSRPMIGHRSEDFKNLYRDVHPKLQQLFATRQPVFLSTSSAWGVMEASI